MKPTYFDVHTHVNISDFDSDRVEVISRCLDNGIWLIVVGSDTGNSEKSVEVAGKYGEGVYATVGLHPTDDLGSDIPVSFKELAKHSKVVAIGECGLEYFRIEDGSEKERQVKIFRGQIELALELDKPLVIHCRDAHDDVIKILEEYKSGEAGEKLRGDLHFFSGSVEQAKKYIELGFLVSFAGVITFAREYEDVIKNIPLEKMMIETDSPYVAPVPYRGKRNEPSYVVEVAKKIAEIKGVSLDEVARVTTQNACNLFGIN